MCIVVCFFDLNNRMIRIHSSFLVAYPPNLQHIFHGTERLSERMNPNGEHCARNCDWGPFYIHLCIPLWLNPLQFHSNHSNLIQTHLNRKFCYLRVPLSPLSIHNGIISIMPVKIPAKHLPSSLPPKISSGLNLAIWQGSQIAEWIMADSVRSRIRCQTTCEDTAFSTVDHRQKSDGQIFRWTSKHLSAICKDVSLTWRSADGGQEFQEFHHEKIPHPGERDVLRLITYVYRLHGLEQPPIATLGSCGGDRLQAPFSLRCQAATGNGGCFYRVLKLLLRILPGK